jgi:5,10-methylenetetrahydrofolate reductase
LKAEEFLRIVEVFPPSFNIDAGTEPSFAVRQKMRDLIEKVKRIERFTDYVLVADVKDASRIKLSTLYTATQIQMNANIRAVPVITARDMNSVAVRTQIITAISSGVEALMLAWGDKYKDEAANVYDYKSLSEMILEANNIAKRCGKEILIMAPVNLSTLEKEGGFKLTKERLDSGASLLLAQPPTTDFKALEKHSRIISEKKLERFVLPNIFPFRDKHDIISCRERFGWELSEELESIADGGEVELLRKAREIAERIREEGFPGIYVSTRGRPEIARYILE